MFDETSGGREESRSRFFFDFLVTEKQKTSNHSSPRPFFFLCSCFCVSARGFPPYSVFFLFCGAFRFTRNRCPGPNNPHSPHKPPDPSDRCPNLPRLKAQGWTRIYLGRRRTPAAQEGNPSPPSYFLNLLSHLIFIFHSQYFFLLCVIGGMWDNILPLANGLGCTPMPPL